MKKIFFTALIILTSANCVISQNLNDDLIKLARAFRNHSFRTDITPNVIDQLNAIANPELTASKKFIIEACKKNNAIATAEFLKRPDSLTLRHLFFIRSINWNLHEADATNNNRLIDSLNQVTTSTYEQLACYYGLLFVSIGNKNQPLDMAKININLDDYGLKDDTEKGILFLKGMDLFGTMIWGYMNVVKPPNYEKALEVIHNYPTFNDLPYYHFQDLNFPDFALTLDKRKEKQSFKKYYINKYLNTLYYHAASAGQKKKDKKEKEDVLLSSIMKNESYYKYSDNPKVFTDIFQRIDKD